MGDNKKGGDLMRVNEVPLPQRTPKARPRIKSNIQLAPLTMRRKGFLPYIQRILDSYLTDRTIWFTGMDGKRHAKAMEAGVPQGSVLGPVLWNIAFDKVLNLADDDEKSDIICYADDTLIVSTGKDRRHVRLRTSMLLIKVIKRISELGLKVSTEKTEAMLFHGKEVKVFPRHITVGEAPIDLAPSIKYLGILIDVHWTFSHHFRYIEEKANRVIRALNWLMPNLKGPDERRRRLFANVIMSVILYGAPVWGDVLATSRLLPALYRLQRTVAQRVISAYRTVMCKRIYEQIKARIEDGDLLTDGVRKEIKDAEFMRLCERWREQLERPNTPGELTKMAVVPRLEAWLSRDSGSSMSFHLTQIFTGHGSFGKFLAKIGKRVDTTCVFCGEDMDDVHHTIRDCPMWDTQRITLRRKLGLARDFTLSDVVEAIVGSEDCWRTFSAYVEEVMREKEDEERRRERARISSSSSTGDDEPG
ncbi:reverse transcriptase [Lasius niger]|uniref:Reverse transcriptase n=1 Tax=Lasius niger TaxID=67767 RepID=A0A0J7KCZ9_LASNI|nr:reverse transcriptase [Lasius niger]KMQ88067.1 reverse transcriptase [Lasius niger]